MGLLAESQLAEKAVEIMMTEKNMKFIKLGIKRLGGKLQPI